jgi:hypothetical protein
MRTRSYHPTNQSTSTWRCLRRTLPSARLDVLYCQHTPSVSRTASTPPFVQHAEPSMRSPRQRYVTSTHARARSDRKVYFNVLCCAFTKPLHRAWHTSACSPRHYSQPVSGRCRAGPVPSVRPIIHCCPLPATTDRPTDRPVAPREVTAAEQVCVRSFVHNQTRASAAAAPVSLAAHCGAAHRRPNMRSTVAVSTGTAPLRAAIAHDAVRMQRHMQPRGAAV